MNYQRHSMGQEEVVGGGQLVRSYSSLQYVAKYVNQVATDQQAGSHGQQVNWTQVHLMQDTRVKGRKGFKGTFIPI